MWYRKAKRYLVAATFSAVLLVLSGLASGSVVSAAANEYRWSGYDRQVWHHEWRRERRGWERHLRHERREWWRHHRAGYYDRYGHFHRYGH